MTGALADALAGGGKFIKWKEIGQGTIVTGTVTDVKLRQSRKIKRQNGAYVDDGPATWDDGSPKMEAVIELATTMRDGADDDGHRSLSINLWSGQKRALADACRKAGVPEPRPGDTFSAVWTSGAGDVEEPRVFAYQITPGVGLASVITETPAPVADPFATTVTQMPADHAMAPPVTTTAAAAPVDAAALLASLTPEQQAALAALSK